jgi:hypothetical protein
MRPAVQHDFDWQRQFIPRMKQILANYLITEAPFEEDTKRNTDLLVLEARTTRVACRIRRHEYLDQKNYRNEFTLRAKRPNGVETELQKVLRGFGDYIFYGFANADGDGLSAWLLGDLGEFRLWHHRALALLPKGTMPGILVPNADKSSEGRAYRIAEIGPRFLVARYPKTAGVAA